MFLSTTFIPLVVSGEVKTMFVKVTEKISGKNKERGLFTTSSIFVELKS